MKLSFRFYALIFLAFFLFGCNLVVPPTKILLPEPTSSSNAIPLEIDNQKVSLEFLQDDTSVPCTNNNNLWKVSLRPEPFTLMVFGDKNVVSIMALKSIDMTLPLQNVLGPSVTLSSMGNMFWEHNLYLNDQPDDIKIFDSASFDPPHSTEFSDYLKNKLGIEPTIFQTRRTYLGIEHGGEPSYSINKISNKTIGDYIQSGNSVALVVFIQKDLGKDILQINWVIFNLEFQ